jgi:hypothetical protein
MSFMTCFLHSSRSRGSLAPDPTIVSPKKGSAAVTAPVGRSRWGMTDFGGY